MKRRSLQRFLRKILIPFGIILMLFTACTREPEVIRTETEKTEPVSESVTETDPETEKTTETETVSESESESTEDPEAREESASENTADTESESESETESSEETETAAPKNSHEGEAVFFGHYMNADIAALNQRTLNSEGAHLYDVLSEPSFGAESVRECFRVCLKTTQMRQSPSIPHRMAVPSIKRLALCRPMKKRQ